MNLEEVNKRIKENPHLRVWVGLHDRVGFTFLLTALEWRFFRPDTLRNREFVLMFVKHNGVPFLVAIFDSRMIQESEIQALVSEAKLVEKKGQINIFGGGLDPKFPLFGDNVYSLSYCKGHEAYDGDSDIVEDLRESFRQRIQEEYTRPYDHSKNVASCKLGHVSVEEIFESSLRQEVNVTLN